MIISFESQAEIKWSFLSYFITFNKHFTYHFMVNKVKHMFTGSHSLSLAHAIDMFLFPNVYCN